MIKVSEQHYIEFVLAGIFDFNRLNEILNQYYDSANEQPRNDKIFHGGDSLISVINNKISLMATINAVNNSIKFINYIAENLNFSYLNAIGINYFNEMAIEDFDQLINNIFPLNNNKLRNCNFTLEDKKNNLTNFFVFSKDFNLNWNGSQIKLSNIVHYNINKDFNKAKLTKDDKKSIGNFFQKAATYPKKFMEIPS